MEHLSSGRSNGAPGSADLLQKPSAVGMAALMSREMRKKSHIPKKTVIVYAPHINETFEVALFSGSSDQALHRSCATRARVAPFLQDGRDTFYFTSGAATDAIVPLCEGLPDGVRLTMHVTAHSAAGNSSRPSGAPAPPPPAASAPAAPPAAPPTQAEQEDAAAKKLQAIQRGHMSRKQGVPLYDEATRYLRRTCGVCMPWVSDGEQYEKVKEHKADNEEDEVVRGMAKMSRLATDMANERTLLAWIRTILAVMRTVRRRPQPSPRALSAILRASRHQIRPNKVGTCSADASVSRLPPSPPAFSSRLLPCSSYQVFACIGMVGVGAVWGAVHNVSIFLTIVMMLVASYVGISRYLKVWLAWPCFAWPCFACPCFAWPCLAWLGLAFPRSPPPLVSLLLLFAIPHQTAAHISHYTHLSIPHLPRHQGRQDCEAEGDPDLLWARAHLAGECCHRPRGHHSRRGGFC